MKKNIALVTPLKNEIDNLPKLIKSIELQSMCIFSWVIIENDSDDGSTEYLNRLIKVENVQNLKVLHLEFENKDYQLGIKYSTIVKHGFEYLQATDYFDKIEYIGILDADCFPESNYYRKLIQHFEKDFLLGIASGIIKYPDNTIEKSNADRARGGCRLWRIECFNNNSYEIGMSADSISGAKALLNGWSVNSFEDAMVFSRKVGSRYTSMYPGISAYYRWVPLHYILIKFFLLILKFQFKEAYGLLSGYIYAMAKKIERLENQSVAKYYKKILFKKFK